MNYYSSLPRKVHFDMHSPISIEGIGLDFDVKDYAKQVKASGADAAVVFAKCAYGFTYVENDYLPNHPNLIYKDLFGEIKKALDKEGVGTVGYVSAASMPQMVAGEHLDWPGRNVKGEINTNAVDHEMVLACVNSDFWRLAYIPMLKQLVGNNGVSAIWMDGFYQLFNEPCYCEKCQKDYGHPIPVEDSDLNWRPYFNYIYKKMLELFNDIKEAVTSENPECCIGGDWIGSVMWASEVPSAIDFFSCDVHMSNSSFETAYASSAWSFRDRPVDVYSERMYWWQDFNTRSVEAVILDQATNVASGGIFMLGDIITPYHMTIHPEKVRFYKDVFDYVNPLYEITNGGESVADIALLVSVEDTRCAGKSWTSNPDKHKGMFSAIIEAGFSVHSLFESDLKQRLEQYKVLVISEANYISREAFEAISSFVENGGKLIAVGGLPIVLNADELVSDDYHGDRTLFESLAGVSYIEDYDFNLSFFNVDQTPMAKLWGDKISQLPECVEGSVSCYHPNGAKVLAPLIAPGQVFQIGARVPGDELDAIAFSHHKVLDGDVYFGAQALATNVWKNGHVSSYHSIQSLIKEAAKDVDVYIEGPSMVQVIPMINGDEIYTLIAHQLPAQNSYKKIMMNLASIADVKVMVKGEIKEVINLETNEALEFTYESNYTTIMAPNFKVFTSIGVKR